MLLLTAGSMSAYTSRDVAEGAHQGRRVRSPQNRRLAGTPLTLAPPTATHPAKIGRLSHRTSKSPAVPKLSCSTQTSACRRYSSRVLGHPCASTTSFRRKIECTSWLVVKFGCATATGATTGAGPTCLLYREARCRHWPDPATTGLQSPWPTANSTASCRLRTHETRQALFACWGAATNPAWPAPRSLCALPPTMA